MNRRLLPMALGLVLLVPASGPVAAAAPAAVTISSAIAPGVVTGLAGFGTSSVVVPAGEKITFLARTEPALPGRRVEIWTMTRTADWQPTTSRLEASDGSVHYVATVNAWTAIQARVPADPSTNAAASHGRIATASSSGLVAIGVTCDEFAAANGGTVARSLVLRSSDLVGFTLCSNASTGFAWQKPTFNTASLRLISDRALPPANPRPGAAGSETWTFRVLGRGTNTISLVYSQPWAGGKKAAWGFSLSVAVVSPTGSVETR
jgi:predicted secreted protein